MFLGQQSAAENFQCLVLVLKLAALVLAFYHHAGGEMCHTDGTGGLVDVLAACAGGTEGINAQILHVQRKVHFLCLRHHGHRGGGCVDAALGLGLRHTLHPVHTALVFQTAVGPVAVHREDGFLHAAQFRLVEVEHFQLPSPALRVHAVHAQQAVSEQGGFFAARTAANLHDDVFAVVGIFGQ